MLNLMLLFVEFSLSKEIIDGLVILQWFSKELNKVKQDSRFRGIDLLSYIPIPYFP